MIDKRSGSCIVIGDDNYNMIDTVFNKEVNNKLKNRCVNKRVSLPYTLKITVNGKKQIRKFSNVENLSDYLHNLVLSQYFTFLSVNVNRYRVFKRNG